MVPSAIPATIVMPIEFRAAAPAPEAPETVDQAPPAPEPPAIEEAPATPEPTAAEPAPEGEAADATPMV